MEPRIRPARTTDPVEVGRLYDVCLRTGDAGADATDRYADPRLIGDVHLGAYLALEPELAFVLDHDGVAVGYVVGARDTADFEERCEAGWWPAVRERYPVDAFPAGTPEAALVRRVHEPPRTPRAVVERYPAHLHVDLLPVAQGGGNGRRLLETLFDALRRRGVPGVHLGVARANERAVGFYRHLGLTEVAGTERALTFGTPL